jgi:hypothetical protein
VTGAFEARYSHVEVKRRYGSKISKSGFIKITIGLTEPIKKGETIRFLFNRPKKLGDSQGGSSIRSGFRVTPMRFMLQRYK